MTEEGSEYKGYWWFPEKPDKKVPGSLVIKPTEISLSAIGSLLSQGDFWNNSTGINCPNVLLGQTVKGECITMLRVTPGKHKSYFVKSPIDSSDSNYNASLAIVGERHFASESEVIFSSVEFQASLLHEWLCKSGISQKHHLDERSYLSKIEIEFSFPKVLEFCIDSIGSQLKTNYIYNEKPKFSQLELNHNSSLVLTPTTQQSFFNWYEQKLESLRRLLIVLTGFGVKIGNEIIGYGDNLSSGNGSNEGEREKFRIYLKQRDSFRNTANKSPSKLLTSLPTLGIDFNIVLNALFEKYDVLKPALVLYTTNLSIELGYSDFQLLNCMQGLEVLHRRVFGGEYMTDAGYEPIANAIVDSIPSEVSHDHRVSLRSRIKYGNGFSQRKRISLLLDDVWTGCLENFIEERKVFVKCAVETRNYLIHFDDSSTDNVASGADLFYLAERLKILLLTHILLQLDIPRENVYAAIDRFGDFSYLKLRRS